MKKAVALMLALVLTLGLTACGGTTKKDETEGKTAVDIMQAVWDTYAEDEMFPVMSADMEDPTGSPVGKLDVTDAMILENVYGFPTENMELLDDGAFLMHAMNQNTFTGAVYHVADAANVEDVAAALKDATMGRQWLCGFPEKLIIYRVGENFMVAVYGNGEIVDTFETHLTETYESAEVLHTEDLLQ